MVDYTVSFLSDGVLYGSNEITRDEVDRVQVYGFEDHFVKVRPDDSLQCETCESRDCEHVEIAQSHLNDL